MWHLPVLAATALTVMVSCEKKEKSEQLTSGVIKENMDTLVKPGDDFDAFVNGTWFKNNEIPEDKSSYGVDGIIDDTAQENVRKIIEEAAKSDAKDGSNEQKIGDLYNSYMDSKGRDAKGVAPLKPEFEKISKIATYDDLSSYFGHANASGTSTPFSVGVIEDFKDPNSYMLFSWQGGLGLPDREYYLNTDAKSKEILTKYEAHIAKMLELSGVENAASKAKTILNLETAIAQKHITKEEAREMSKMYNPYEVDKLKGLTPNFNWKLFFENAKIKDPKRVVVTQVGYMKNIDGIIKSTSLDIWKDWLVWTVIHENATNLNTALDSENFNFYGKVLSGTTKQRDQWRRAVSSVNRNLGEIVGEVYVKKHFSPDAKKRMSVMVDNLLMAYEQSINELTWMSADTKKEALNKLKKFTPKIGYPDKWRDYSKLKMSADDLYGNMQRSQEFEYNRQIEKLGKKVDRTEWGMTPQTVNAYYNPTLNEIVFPAAILQPPFFDLNADDAVNYGSIGAVIGHEIGHGFDDQGSTFDGDGVLRNWWTDQDLNAFKDRTSALVNQYDAYEVLPGLKVNGAFTLGENIGDLGGLAIALKAYKISLKGKEAPKMDGYTAEQRFFIGYAQSWLVKQREESLRTQVASDPHSPAHFRVNGIVRNIPEWYEAFNVKPTDKLYLAPEKRVKIW